MVGVVVMMKAELGIWGRGIMMGFLSSYGILGILGELGTESGSKVFKRTGGLGIFLDLKVG